MVNYMPIVPIGFLDVLDVTQTQNVFILSQFWNNKKYRDFYLKRQWDTVILDNALYEQSNAVDFEAMLAMARQLDAEQVFVVGPECLTDGIETGRMTIDILNDNDCEGQLDDNINLMCILHERPNEMMEQWNMVRKYRDLAIGISIFSYRLGYDRASLYKFLDIEPCRYVHAFGWDNLMEVYNMRGCFDSVDASIAVSAAINNVPLNDTWQITRNPKYDGRKITERLPIDWEGNDCSGLDDDSMRLQIVRNIQFLDRHCALEGPIYKESELCHKL